MTDTATGDRAANKRHTDDAAHDDGLAARARAQASHAIDTSRDAAADAARRTADTIESNPLGILVGGLALGAIAGALIPRTDKEKELLAPLGRQLGDRARAAAAAAKEAGKAELDQLGLTKGAARDQARGLFEGLAQAAKSAGSAAAKSTADGS